MLRLRFIGDIFPGDEFFTAGFGIRSLTGEERAGAWMREISDVLQEGDFSIGNLEGPLVEAPDEETFCGRPFFADILKGSGINVLNVANNHILEQGVEGYQETLSVLKSRGIHVTGARTGDGEPEILTLTAEGTKVCMAGFCDESISSFENPGCYASLEREKVFETLERMKALQPDVIVLIFHWGNEYIHFPSLKQRELARALIDAGARLIVGHHPHVIQPYEHYKDGHILYSLGNFCFDDVQSARFGKGMTARVEIEAGAITGLSFSGVKVQDMAYGDSLVAPMDAEAFARYFKRIQEEYAALSLLPEAEYQRKYEKLLKREHARERVYMRTSVVKKLLNVKTKHRRQLLLNIRKHLLRP